MKRPDSFTHKLLAGVIALGLMAMATAASAADVPQYIKVLRITGQARYSTDNKTWQQLNTGDILRPGSVIVTAEKSTVDLLMGDKDAVGLTPNMAASAPSAPSVTPISAKGGSLYVAEEEQANLIRIFQSSVMAVDKLNVDRTGVDEVSETQLDLRAGQIMGVVKKLSTPSKYEIKIPNGVAGIRGTVYVLSSSGATYVMKKKPNEPASSLVLALVGSDSLVTTRIVPGGSGYDPATGVVSSTSDSLNSRLVGLYENLAGDPDPKVAHRHHDPRDHTKGHVTDHGVEDDDHDRDDRADIDVWAW